MCLQISRFESLNSCTFEGYEPDSIQYCYSSSELYGVNPKAPMGGQPSANEGVSRALCVEKKNYAFRDEYYLDADVQSSQVFNQKQGQKSYSYLMNFQTETSVETVDSNYDQNDTIPAFILLNTGELVSNGPGYLQIPVGDMSGDCNDKMFAQFERFVPVQPCRRTLSADEQDFIMQCGDWSVSRVATDLFLAKLPNNLASNAAASTSNTITVSIASMEYEDYYTKERTAISLDDWTGPNCNTGYVFDTSTFVANPCFFAPTASQAALLTNPLCNNALKEVEYAVSHGNSPPSSLSSVSVRIVLTDLPYTGEGGQVDQYWGVNFLSNSSATTSPQTTVPRQRSGNPGYLQGLPVLFGYRDNTIINSLVDGLSISSLTPPQSTCPTSIADLSSLSILFGYDTITGCTVPLTREDLRSFCCTGAGGSCLGGGASLITPSPYTSDQGLPVFLNFTAGYVGMYGDADPLDVSQWLSLSLSLPPDERRWNEKTSTCSNVYAGLTIQFLVAPSGERLNPQQKIVAAAAQVVTGDWVFSLPPTDQIRRQTFTLQSAVSFVFQEESKLRGYEPPAPPVLFKMPYDVFYPFVVNAAPTTAAPSIVLVVMSLVCSCVGMLLS
ncbi:DUF1619 domain-containing protein [archaeon]|nr:MAG: DUF1619 domain-containing protein [archaeon]